MISLRRSFATSVFFTGLALLLLAACDLGAVTQPTPDEQPATAAAGTTDQAAPATAEAPTVGAAAESPATPAEPAEPQGGTLTLRVTEPITSFTPWDLRSRADEYVAELMYNGLVQLDASLRPQPDLAERWETSPDGGIISFTLRSGLEWHDGAPLTADDVVWTLNTLRTLTATNSLLFDLQSTIGDVRSPISGTVVLSLTQAYAPILADLAVPILPRERLEARSAEELVELNFLDLGAGSGPFELDEVDERSITFIRNDQYFGGRPNLDGAALVVAPDPAAATEALNEGTILLAEFPATGAATTTAELDPELQQGSYPENGSYFLAFNVRADRPFSDTRVRQALAQAVDVPTLVRDVAGERAQPIATSISPAAWAFPEDAALPQRDLDRSRQLLEEAGWQLPEGQTVRAREGISLTAQLFVRGDDTRRLAAAQRIAADAEEIGMRIEVLPADFDTVILAKLAPPYDFDLLLSSWVNAPNTAGFATNRFYDPDDYAIFGAERIWQGTADTRSGLRNIGGFANPEYETAARQARATYDPDQRAAAIRASQAVIQRELPYLFLWTDRIPVVMSPTIQAGGAAIELDSPRYLWNVERWYIDDEG